MADVLYKKKISLPIRLKLEIACGIAKGMAYAASLRYLHRDLRSSNVLIDKEFNARVADWGLACKRTAANCFPPSLEVVGSLHWMAPEVFRKICRVEKSDVYSYGMTCYELLTETTPFHGISPLNAARIASGQSVDEEDDDPSRTRPDLAHPNPCNDSLFLQSLVEDCWKDEVKERPKFEVITERLSTYLGMSYSPIPKDLLAEEDETEIKSPVVATEKNESAKNPIKEMKGPLPAITTTTTHFVKPQHVSRVSLPRTAAPKFIKMSPSGLPVTCRPPMKKESESE